MIRNRKARIAKRRSASLENARTILRQIVDGSLDAWEGYRRVYGLYLDSSGVLEELKPLFRLSGIEPDGCLRVDDSVRETIRSAAVKWIKDGPA